MRPQQKVCHCDFVERSLTEQEAPGGGGGGDSDMCPIVGDTFKLVSHKTVHHRLERLKNTKVSENIGEKIDEKIGHCYSW